MLWISSLSLDKSIALWRPWSRMIFFLWNIPPHPFPPIPDQVSLFITPISRALPFQTLRSKCPLELPAMIQELVPFFCFFTWDYMSLSERNMLLFSCSTVNINWKKFSLFFLLYFLWHENRNSYFGIQTLQQVIITWIINSLLNE